MAVINIEKEYEELEIAYSESLAEIKRLKEIRESSDKETKQNLQKHADEISWLRNTVVVFDVGEFKFLI